MRYQFLVFILAVLFISTVSVAQESSRNKSAIKAYDLDFNWGEGGPNAFAKPGLWADASPEEHIKWYKALGVNTIQTFAVSCNGYAWYKNGVVPQQPGLTHDFLTEMVTLGHKDGMKVMGYFCIGANTRWGMENPDYSYGYPSDMHIPLTKKYLSYLDSAIRDAVRKTGMDGFMIDWFYQPKRISTGGLWIASEKQRYAELMGKPFPGEKKLSEADYNTYSRLAIEKTWEVIHRAAKETNPNCIIWLTCYQITHPHIINSKMFKEVDWLMNEDGDLKKLDTVKTMIGKQTRLITCLADWNGKDPVVTVENAMKTGIGLYGFAKPTASSLLPPIDYYLKTPLDSLHGDAKTIATFARVYNALPLDFLKEN
jgi:hypothetical protein